jgi:hypothetical protein
VKRLLPVVLIAVLFPLNSFAADKDKNFAVKGLAAASCATFVAERDKQSPTYNEALSWLTGYISAYNYLTPDTYDVAPWQNAELLSFILAAHCKQHPEESFFLASNKLINSIANDRLRVVSDVVTLAVGKYKLTIYKDMVFRIQSALKDKGHLNMRWPTGDYDQSTVEAMKAFQVVNKIDPTGIPDQQSLYLLFSK